MKCLTEKIHWLNLLRFIPKSIQYGNISCQGSWVTGNINNAFWLHVSECLEHGRRTAGSWRINDYNIRARKLYERVGFQTVGELATVLY